jgi:trimethylamine--corrinoid protein Co-methyltransferase
LAKEFLTLVTDSEIGQIRDAAMRILCSQGLVIQSDQVLEKCRTRGIRVDSAKQKIEVTPEIWNSLEKAATRSASEQSSELISRRYGAYDKDTRPSVIRRAIPDGYRLGRNIACIYDLRTGTKRPATLQDNNQMMKALHMLPEVVSCAPLWTSTDLEARIEPIVSLGNAFKISDKPFAEIELMMPGQLKFIEELHSIKEGREIKYHHYFASMTRFTLDQRAAGVMVEIDEANGLTHWGSNSVPIMGLNCPVTIAGAAAVGMAEMFGGWIPAWILNEDVVLSAVPVSASMDMKTSRILFSSPEATLVDATLYQVFNVLYGMSVHTENSATYIDGKVPGLQAVHDKVYKSMTLFAFTGCDVGSHYGYLEAGTSISPAQLMLDFDIDSNMFQTVRGVEVNKETIALEVIENIGVNGSFIETEHTMDHFRNLWNPQLMDRTSYSTDEQEKNREREMLEAAQTKYEEAVARYEPPAVDGDTTRAYDEVMIRARKRFEEG